MKRTEQIGYLNSALLEEMPQYKELAGQFSPDPADQRRLLRSLMNLRPPLPLSRAFLTVQDQLLRAEREEKGVVTVDSLGAGAQVVLWKGDITRLAADAIVNAANSALLGCFCPCHGCIDNAIHSAAGLQLRDECSRVMGAQQHEEPAGRAKLTGAYNLPSRHVLHTVGPIVRGQVTQEDRRLLGSCYRSCLELARRQRLESVAFCCIATGEFHFPHREAAQIAVAAVQEFLSRTGCQIKVIFNVYQEEDERIYRELLRTDETAERSSRLV